MTDAVNIHATCVMLANAQPQQFGMFYSGILLLGESGSGKSDLALRLIEDGALLVSDDRTELFVEDGKLKARAGCLPRWADRAARTRHPRIVP